MLIGLPYISFVVYLPVQSLARPELLVSTATTATEAQIVIILVTVIAQSSIYLAPNSPGSFATFTAMRRASSKVSTLTSL